VADPPSPSPSHQQARWAPNHSLGVTTLRSAAFSRLHTRTRSEWWPWSWRPSSFCSLVLVCPAPALALLKNLPSRFGPHRGMCCALYPFHYSSPLASLSLKVICAQYLSQSLPVFSMPCHPPPWVGQACVHLSACFHHTLHFQQLSFNVTGTCEHDHDHHDGMN
jgi:hypothetical protein